MINLDQKRTKYKILEENFLNRKLKHINTSKAGIIVHIKFSGAARPRVFICTEIPPRYLCIAWCECNLDINMHE